MGKESPGRGDAERSEGLLESLKALLSTLLAMLYNRAEIFATELEEERLRFERRILLAFATVVFLAMALLFLSLGIMFLLWNRYRILALVGVTAFYLVLAGAAFWGLLHDFRSKPRLFQATLSELDKDRRGLGRKP
ncbi:MAG: phage holin family protein [Betaproteobacteria bacterium]|nr:phage holin family protein [Betaproteobacteria bacterium]